MFGRLCLTLLGLLISATASAQTCESNMSVKPGQTVTNFSWFIYGNEGRLQSLSCKAAELLREDLFLSGANAINEKAFNDLQAYKSDAKKHHDSLVQQINAAKAAINGGQAGAGALLQVAIYEFNKATTLISCLAPDPTAASKALCAVLLAILAKDTHDLVTNPGGQANMQKMIADLEQELAKLETEYQRVISLGAAMGLSEAAQRRKQMFDAMCQSIKQSCL
jgi:hypothetical protein